MKLRNSSIELYRILATFAVIITHFNGWFVGGIPPYEGINNLTTTQVGQVFIASATCICVNMFLLISGFCGLHLRMKSILKLCLILLFISYPFYIIKCIYYNEFSIKSFIGCFFVISKFGYFIQSYFMLLFFSPIINSFIEKYTRRNVLYWTLLFVMIELWFGDIMEKDSFGFSMGYSVIHFVLMYFVGRCVYLYRDIIIKPKRFIWGVSYVICTLVICILYAFNVNFAFHYSNPLVILSSICTFVPFLYFSYHNNIINWIASATLPVYIIQVCSPANELLINLDKYLLFNFPYYLYLLLAAFAIVLFFIFCVLYGKACNYAINPILNYLSVRIGSKYDLL